LGLQLFIASSFMSMLLNQLAIPLNWFMGVVVHWWTQCEL